MELSELTPELFEKAEFTERRRGYDIDQVERFLEETGTAVAQLLVRYRQIEERAVHAESRVAEAEARAAAAAEKAASAQPAPAAPAPAAGMSEAEEIERATTTLVMARRTAEATVGEARAEAQGIVSEARAGADRIVADARSEAEAELADGRARVEEVVSTLEQRRDHLTGLVAEFETRIATYRNQLAEVAGALNAMVADPEALAERPEIVVPKSASGYSTDLLGPVVAPTAERAGSVDQPTQSYEAVATGGEPEGWGEGSWSAVVAAEAAAPEAVAPEAVAEPGPVEAEQTISLTDLEPATGQTSDRFLRELDEAVNESKEQEGDEAMNAFFDGNEEPGRPRFGWRR